MSICRKKELQIPRELADPILNQDNMVSLLVFLNKDYNRKFYDKSGKGRNPQVYEKFIHEYCDRKLNTNPRWSYLAYKYDGTNSKLLNCYLIQAIKDIPWKYILTTFAINIMTNFIFQKVQNKFIAFAIISCYFLIVHLITIAALCLCNCCTNFKKLFRNFAILLVMLNLLINISHVA